MTLYTLSTCLLEDQREIGIFYVHLNIISFLCQSDHSISYRLLAFWMKLFFSWPNIAIWYFTPMKTWKFQLCHCTRYQTWVPWIVDHQKFFWSVSFRSSHAEVFCEKRVLRNFAKFTGKHLCQSLFFNKSWTSNFIKKETLAQVFSCEICDISKNTFSYRAPW